MANDFCQGSDMCPDLKNDIGSKNASDYGGDLANDTGVDLNVGVDNAESFDGKENLYKGKIKRGFAGVMAGIAGISGAGGDPEAFDRDLDNKNRLNTRIGSDYAAYCDVPEGFEEGQSLIRETQLDDTNSDYWTERINHFNDYNDSNQTIEPDQPEAEPEHPIETETPVDIESETDPEPLDTSE